MSKNSGSMQSELAAKDDEIAKLNRKIQELEKELLVVKKEKQSEIDLREQERAAFESKIKDLEG